LGCAGGPYVVLCSEDPITLTCRRTVLGVGKDNLIKIVGNGPDGQTTDKNVSEPTIRTYAEAVMRNSQTESAGSVRTKGKAIRRPPLTFKNNPIVRTV
jgi:hypothetical protein